ncbi:MAG TPA: Zn-dependent hydrolase [Solirubrobacteraceae bacterium]
MRTAAPSQVAAARVLARLETLFALGPKPHANRPGLSAEEETACRLAAAWMEEAGLAVTWDAAGNVVGRAPGTSPELPEVWTGSHLDTVPSGGRFDGALGVIAGIEAVCALAGRGLTRSVAVAAFRDEEGWRFGRGLFGSRALCGRLSDGEAADTDPDGVTLGDAVAALGRPWPPAGGWLDPGIHAFLELHIEQGPVLADAGAPLGIVREIVGMSGFEVAFTGSPGHAGTTPMQCRVDALGAAATMVVALHAAAAGIEDAVATVGRLDVHPGASNVIPEHVVLSVDARAPDDARLDALQAAVEETSRAAAEARGAGVVVRRTWRLPPAAMAPEIRAALARSLAVAGVPVIELPSGAGHDAQVFSAAGIPTGMLFTRSLAGGVSHSPWEHTDAEALELAVRALRGALAELAG